MISKCANPNCDTEFRHFNEGRIFPYQIQNPEEPCRDVPTSICERKPRIATIYFWLCGSCCERFTLQFTVHTGVRLVPLCREKDIDRKTSSQSGAASETESFRERHA